MQTQNFENHSTLKTPTRIFIYFILIASLLFIASIANMCHAIMMANGRATAALFVLIAVITIISYFLFRSFSLKAQDRAIRAEENLRYFVLTGKLLDSNLKINQIVALRFASDSELVSLTERAVKENLSNKEIKMSIKNWKADYHRA